MRKSSVLILLLVLFCGVMSSGASALVYTYPGNAPDGTSWQTWGSRAVIDYMSSYYGRDTPDGIFKSNCFMFVRLVLKLENEAGYKRGYITNYNGSYKGPYPYGRELYTYGGASIVTQHFNDRDGMPTASIVEKHFSKAHTADVVQMCWGSSQHTALINGFEERDGKRGVRFFHANQGYSRVIKEEFFSFETLAEKYSVPRDKGGFTIYCFGHAPGGESAPWITPPGLPINSANFPDPVFRDYVSYYDTNRDGYFSDAEIEAITDFSWHGGPHPDNVNPNAWSGYEPKALINENGNGEKWASIKSIEGVKLFKNLESLYVYNDSLSGAIDISGMKKLKDFRCYGNRITSINASNCSALQRLECQSNRLSSINLAGCSQLEYLDVSDNYLRSLRFDDYTFDTSHLKTLKCRDNLLTYLSASYCDSLQVVDCSSNMLYSLYLNGCPNLTEIYCQNNSSLRSISLGTVSTKKLKVLEHDSSLDSALRSYLPRITSSNIPSTASVGKSYSGYIKASGSGIITYGSTALLSAHGLTINEDTGRITGTPKYSGTYSYKFFAENFAGTVSRDATITISGRNAPRIITTSIKTLKKGTYYGPSAFYTNNIPIKATGGTVPMTWSKYSGTLPAGLSLSYTSSSTVYLTGTPKTTGYYGFTLKVRDRYGLEDTQYFYVRVK